MSSSLRFWNIGFIFNVEAYDVKHLISIAYPKWAMVSWDQLCGLCMKRVYKCSVKSFILCSKLSLGDVMMMKLRRLRWMGHVACMGK